MSELAFVSLEDIAPSGADVRLSASAGGTGGPDGEGFADLVASIATHGILQPITLRPWAAPPDAEPDAPVFKYTIIEGRRRRLAAEAVGLAKLPSYILPATPDPLDSTVKALVANMQRGEMSPYEEARAIEVLKAAGSTGKQVAKLLGKSQAWVSRRLDVLKLPEDRAKALRQGDMAQAQEEVQAHKRAAKGQKAPRTNLKPKERVEKAGKLIEKAIELLEGLKAYRELVAELVPICNALTGKDVEEEDK